jgi:hypothetical protein
MTYLFIIGCLFIAAIGIVNIIGALVGSIGSIILGFIIPFATMILYHRIFDTNPPYLIPVAFVLGFLFFVRFNRNELNLASKASSNGILIGSIVACVVILVMAIVKQKFIFLPL